jgi:hypothetical protein
MELNFTFIFPFNIRTKVRPTMYSPAIWRPNELRIDTARGMKAERKALMRRRINPS